MNWIKENKKLATIVGFILAGVVGLGVWLFLAWSDFSAAKADWETTSGKVAVLQKNKDYPSHDNVVKAGEKLAEFKEKAGTLRTVLLSPKLQEQVKPMSETELQQKVKERTKALKEKAAASGTKLPADFALGFEEYMVSLPPSAEIAAELNVHVDVMEKLATTFTDAGVASIDVFERTKLPGEKSGKVTKPAPAPQPAPRPGNKSQAKPVARMEAEPVLDRYTIKAVITTDQVPLQNVINVLSNPAKMPDFLAVRMLRVENQKIDAPTKEEIKMGNLNAPPEEPKPAAPSDAGKKASAGSRVIEPPPPAKADAKTIMGEEQLKAYLEIDYIRFRPSPDDAAPVENKN